METKKVYYRGVKGRGEEIIKALEALGGVNKYTAGNDNEAFYYIGKDNIIRMCYECADESYLLKQLYTEVFLPDPKIEITIKQIAEKFNCKVENLVIKDVYNDQDDNDELKEGDMAIMWDDKKSCAQIMPFVRIDECMLYPYRSINIGWMNAIKFKSVEQFKQFIE